MESEIRALRSIVRKVQMGAGLTVTGDGVLAGRANPGWGYPLTGEEVTAWNAVTAEAPLTADDLVELAAYAERKATEMKYPEHHDPKPGEVAEADRIAALVARARRAATNLKEN
jgi:hypothetical protein